MPKPSLEGSIFPGLEQEQRSAPHPRRNQTNRAAQSPKSAENSRKTEQAGAEASQAKSSFLYKVKNGQNKT